MRARCSSTPSTRCRRTSARCSCCARSKGLDVRETAECLGVNAATVRTRLFRAQRLLRVELSRRLQGESTEIFDFGAERCDGVVALRAGSASRI